MTKIEKPVESAFAKIMREKYGSTLYTQDTLPTIEKFSS
jgi:hypothetical protein